MVGCLPVDPATWVRFPAGTGKIFSLYDSKMELDYLQFCRILPIYALYDVIAGRLILDQKKFIVATEFCAS